MALLVKSTKCLKKCIPLLKLFQKHPQTHKTSITVTPKPDNKKRKLQADKLDEHRLKKKQLTAADSRAVLMGGAWEWGDVGQRIQSCSYEG